VKYRIVICIVKLFVTFCPTRFEFGKENHENLAVGALEVTVPASAS
jgi:hypothetical protein